MSTQNSYYKLIRAILEKLSNTTTESIQSIDQPTSYDDNNLSPTSESISNETIDLLNHNKEEIAHQRKDWQHFAIKIFLTKFTELNKRAKKTYLKIIHDFIQFSPDIEYGDLKRFMENKFNITSPGSDLKAPYEANQAKYALLLKRLLRSIYNIDDIETKVLHNSKKNKIC